MGPPGEFYPVQRAFPVLWMLYRTACPNGYNLEAGYSKDQLRCPDWWPGSNPRELPALGDHAKRDPLREQKNLH